LNGSFKEFISIETNNFDDFIKACGIGGIGKRSKARCFRKSKYQLKGYKEVT